MKIDLLCELQPPTYLEALARIEVAEEVGFACVWAIDTPEILHAAVAMRTERIRIGCGLHDASATPEHPIRVAERVATLDVISQGRVEWSSAPGNFEPGAWHEALEMIPRMWNREGVFAHRSERFDIPDSNVTPKPLQDPHPPIWAPVRAVGDRSDSWREVGRLGIGVLDLSRGRSHEELSQAVCAYREALQEAEPVGPSTNGRVAVRASCSVSSTDGGLEAELEACRQAGCDRVVIDVDAGHSEHTAAMRAIERLGREIIPRFDSD